jgi:hypothetical protein
MREAMSGGGEGSPVRKRERIDGGGLVSEGEN